jgi:hypothetical protein
MAISLTPSTSDLSLIEEPPVSSLRGFSINCFGKSLCAVFYRKYCFFLLGAYVFDFHYRLDRTKPRVTFDNFYSIVKSAQASSLDHTNSTCCCGIKYIMEWLVLHTLLTLTHFHISHDVGGRTHGCLALHTKGFWLPNYIRNMR